jgi:hypothetical protein
LKSYFFKRAFNTINQSIDWKERWWSNVEVCLKRRKKRAPRLFLHRFTTSSTSDAFTGVITVLMSSAKETKDGF